MSTNWLPGSRVGQVAMALVWKGVLENKGDSWSVPAAALTNFGNLVSAAQLALAKVQDKASRTHVDSVACNAAFKALVDGMRLLKNNFSTVRRAPRRNWQCWNYPPVMRPRSYRRR